MTIRAVALTLLTLMGATSAIPISAAVTPANVQISRSSIEVPAVRLIDSDGREVALRDALNDGRPVVLNFIYTSCASVCPLLSQAVAGFRSQLGAQRERVHVVSISIDPEQDSPQVLRSYARQFHGDRHWDYYSGSLPTILSVQRAFGVYKGDKMAHTPVTFIRSSPQSPWTRIDGFVTSGQLLQSYRDLVAAR